MKTRDFKLGYLDWIVPIVAAVAIVGCSDALQSPGSATHNVASDRSDRMLHGALIKRHERGEQRALRVKVDAARNRLWVLGLEHLYVYDTNGKQLIRRIALPAWSVAGIECSPDMILDPAGSALISSNAVPKLWKIDAEDFSVKQHEITLNERENWDTGFGALAFAADGTLFGMTAFAGSLWRIDMARSSASEVKLSERVMNTCNLTTPRETILRASQRGMTLCAVSGKGTQRIVISPDFTRGLVSGENCPS